MWLYCGEKTKLRFSSTNEFLKFCSFFSLCDSLNCYNSWRKIGLFSWELCLRKTFLFQNGVLDLLFFLCFLFQNFAWIFWFFLFLTFLYVFFFDFFLFLKALHRKQNLQFYLMARITHIWHRSSLQQILHFQAYNVLAKVLLNNTSTLIDCLSTFFRRYAFFLFSYFCARLSRILEFIHTLIVMVTRGVFIFFEFFFQKQYLIFSFVFCPLRVCSFYLSFIIFASFSTIF